MLFRSRDRFRQDVMAGIIVGIVAIPLAMAFAIASGVSPDRGLYTAIIAGAAISIFGGSRVQIGGPTGAMVAILSVIVLQYGLNNLLLAGFVAVAAGAIFPTTLTPNISMIFSKISSTLSRA